VIKSIDEAQVRAAVDRFAHSLMASNRSVQEIVVFGSFERGNYGPGSDVDVFVLLTHSDKSIRDRIPDLLPLEFPVPMDVFPYTTDEVEALKPSPVLDAVAASGWRYKRRPDAG
jgi:Nucleotidyltransferase domain